jgi:hypothetical protein
MPVKSTRNLHKAEIISLDVIERRILALRGHSVMFDRDLATALRRRNANIKPSRQAQSRSLSGGFQVPSHAHNLWS